MRLIAATGLMLLLPTAGVAADRYHVVTPSFGCVVPWTTWALNDARNPHHHDRRWLGLIAARGGCRLVSPIVEWERVGRIGRLALMRQVPPHVGATPLLFRPSDLRLGEIADPAPSAPAAALPPAPPAAQPDAAPAAAPVGPATASPAAPAVPPLAPAGAAPGASPAASPTDVQAAKPAGPDAVAPPAPSDPAAQGPAPAASPPAAGPTNAQATTPAGRVVASVPTSSDPAVHGPAAAAPSSTGPAAATVPVAPAPEAAAPAAPVPPSPQAPAAAASDAGTEPPAASTGRPAGTLGAAWGPSPWNRVLIGAASLLALLATAVLLSLRLLRRRRRWRDTAVQPPAEAYDPPPEALADEAEMPPIDGNAYRQWCVDSLIEAGWQARMGFPAGRLTADIMARRDGRLLTVQCRPSMRPLEATVVQEALVVRRAQDAQIAAVVSNAGYTRAARNLAAASGVRLLHETELTEFVS